MFRKIANILVLILFIVSTTGFTISKHYCHGNLVSVSINVEAKSCCGVSDNDCCKNENEFCQLTDDFAATMPFNIVNDFSFDISLFVQESFGLVSTTEIGSIYLNKGFIPPPDLSVVLADLQSFRL